MALQTFFREKVPHKLENELFRRWITRVSRSPGFHHSNWHHNCARNESFSKLLSPAVYFHRLLRLTFMRRPSCDHPSYWEYHRYSTWFSSIVWSEEWAIFRAINMMTTPNCIHYHDQGDIIHALNDSETLAVHSSLDETHPKPPYTPFKFSAGAFSLPNGSPLISINGRMSEIRFLRSIKRCVRTNPETSFKRLWRIFIFDFSEQPNESLTAWISKRVRGL